MPWFRQEPCLGNEDHQGAMEGGGRVSDTQPTQCQLGERTAMEHGTLCISGTRRLEGKRTLPFASTLSASGLFYFLFLRIDTSKGTQYGHG